MGKTYRVQEIVAGVEELNDAWFGYCHICDWRSELCQTKEAAICELLLHSDDDSPHDRRREAYLLCDASEIEIKAVMGDGAKVIQYGEHWVAACDLCGWQCEMHNTRLAALYELVEHNETQSHDNRIGDRSWLEMTDEEIDCRIHSDIPFDEEDEKALIKKVGIRKEGNQWYAICQLCNWRSDYSDTKTSSIKSLFNHANYKEFARYTEPGEHFYHAVAYVLRNESADNLVLHKLRFADTG